MLADQRRWLWQPRQQCGWSQLANRGDLVAMICDGGSAGGFFPTACGRDFVHPSHPLGQPPKTAGSSLTSDQFSAAAGPNTSCPSCESVTRDGLALGRKAIDKGDGPEWCDDEWHDQEDTDTGSYPSGGES
jgi:hypothetical protein